MKFASILSGVVAATLASGSLPLALRRTLTDGNDTAATNSSTSTFNMSQYISPIDKYGWIWGQDRAALIAKSRAAAEAANSTSHHVNGRGTSGGLGAESCVPPLEVLILQDITDSFQDNIQNMIDTQLEAIFNGIQETNPNSKFAVGTVKDKPLSPFGFPGGNGVVADYCWHLEMDHFTSNLTELVEVYKGFQDLVGGGDDAPECQYYGIFAAMGDTNINWGHSPGVQQLVITVTDSVPHYDGDGSVNPGMVTFSGSYDMGNPEKQCTSMFYPTADQAVEITYHTVGETGYEPWFAFLIYDDGIPTEGFTTDAWAWYCEAIGLNPALFLKNINADGSNTWEQLSQIIGSLDTLSCRGGGRTTTGAPGETTTAAAPATTTAAAVETTTAAAVAPKTARPAPQPITRGPAPDTTTTPAATTTSVYNGPTCSWDCCNAYYGPLSNPNSA